MKKLTKVFLLLTLFIYVDNVYAEDDKITIDNNTYFKKVEKADASDICVTETESLNEQGMIYRRNTEKSNINKNYDAREFNNQIVKTHEHHDIDPNTWEFINQNIYCYIDSKDTETKNYTYNVCIKNNDIYNAVILDIDSETDTTGISAVQSNGEIKLEGIPTLGSGEKLEIVYEVLEGDYQQAETGLPRTEYTNIYNGSVKTKIGNKVHFAVYYSNDKCKDMIIHEFDVTATGVTDNPYYSDKSVNVDLKALLNQWNASIETETKNYNYNSLCKYVVNYNGTLSKVLNDLFNECSLKQIHYSDLDKFKHESADRWRLIEKFLNNSNSKTTESYECSFNSGNNNSSSSGKTDLTYTSTLYKGTYWEALCTETLHINYDSPKAVLAGGSFDYKTDISITRECLPIQIKKPKLTETCKYGIECYGSGHNGTIYAGPNDDFDECINKCDGGEYTQKCIDKCYDSVYQINNDNNWKIDKLSFINDNYQVVPVVTKSPNYQKKCDLSDIIGKTKADCGNIPTPNVVSSNCVVGSNDKNSLSADCKAKLPVFMQDKEQTDGSYKFYTEEVIHPYYGTDPEKDAFTLSSKFVSREAIYGPKMKKNTSNRYWIISEHGVLFWFANVCNNKVKCYEVYKTDKNCSTESTLQAYADELEKYYLEYLSVVQSIKNFDCNDEELFEIEVDEQYGDKKEATTVFSNKDEKKLYLTEETVYGGMSTESYSITDLLQGIENPNDLYEKLKTQELKLKLQNNKFEVNAYRITRKVNIGIGASYLSSTGDKITGYITSKTSNTVAYKTDSCTSVPTTNENQCNKSCTFDKNMNKDNKLLGPFYRYFTSMSTKNLVNNPSLWPYYNDSITYEKRLPQSSNTGLSIDLLDAWPNYYDIPISYFADTKADGSKNYNIRVKLSKIGSWQQWGQNVKYYDNKSTSKPIDISCIYGTGLNGFIDNDGIQYMFRVVDLGDVFPNNRNPRWNWTGTITGDLTTGAAMLKKNALLYQVDPIKLTDNIETKAQDIYRNDEGLDYEITISRKQINNIRSYNKDKKTYVNYDLDCSKRVGDYDYPVCTSKFLDNEEYVIFKNGKDLRKNLAGCNNSYGGSCTDSGK